ncbi:MAG: SDR family oxidoreductase, partial [Alphaproteobacteria bacterium]|nr:SDR family oxidoreductase [Alphaproteobacteria bacterium]
MAEASPRKVAIVTGGARGIGRACAKALARAGHAIALVDLLVPEMERTAGEIRELGQEALIFEADVASHARAKAIVADVRKSFGRLDFLLNDAGKSMPKSILEISEEEFDRTIAINLKSCFNYIQAVAPVMLEQGGGRIASMSSLNAYSGGVTAAVSRFAYASAKAGILGMTRALAKELGPTILVNAICPGIIETELGNTLTRSRGGEIASSGIALRRV